MVSKEIVTCTKLNFQSSFRSEKTKTTSDEKTQNFTYIIRDSSTNKLSKLCCLKRYKLKLLDSILEYRQDDALKMKNETKAIYGKRYFILFLFCICSMLNAFQFIQYSIISNIIECYHHVTPFDVNWTSIVYMITYGVLVFPVSWFINRFDTRITILVGSILNCLSALLQCFSLEPNGFPIVITSQTVSAIAQVFILPLPPRIAAVWFLPKQVGRVTAIAVFANQFGAAIGALIPPTVISNDCSKAHLIRYGRGLIAYSLITVNIVNFLLLLVFFKNKPSQPSPESIEISETETSFRKSLRLLLKDLNFLLLMLSYGIIIGVVLSVGTLLNQILSPMYPNFEEAIGWTSIGSISIGFLSSFIAGYVTDITRKYRETSLLFCWAGLLTMASFTGLLYIRQFWIQCITVLLVGLFLAGYLPIGIDYAAEITYPVSEGTSASLMNASSMIFSAVITILGSYMLQSYGWFDLGLFWCGAVAIALISCHFIKPELKRTKAKIERTEDKSSKITVAIIMQPTK